MGRTVVKRQAGILHPRYRPPADPLDASGARHQMRVYPNSDPKIPYKVDVLVTFGKNWIQSGRTAARLER
jgi:hypothetical protein